MATVIYQRVSSRSQEFIRQEHLFQERGINPDKIFEETASAKDTERPQLKAMLEWVRNGDTLYVESISRLARSTRDFLEIVEMLEKKGVHLVSLKESIDTSTATGRFLLSVFGALAQLERETMKERQRESIEARRFQKLPIGRPRAILSKTFPKNYERWKSGEIMAVEFMKLEKLHKSTFYKLVKVYEAKQVLDSADTVCKIEKDVTVVTNNQ